MRYNISEKKYEKFLEFRDKRNLETLAISHDDRHLFITTQQGEVFQLSIQKPDIIVNWPNMYQSELNNQQCASELAVTPGSKALIYSIFGKSDRKNFLQRISLEKENSTKDLNNKWW